MRVDLFDFDLPDDRIALHPARPRDSSRLLVVAGDGRLDDRRFRDLADLLDPGDALVVNNTSVIHAELEGIRRRGDSAVAVHANLIRRLTPARWQALARPGKRLAAGDRIGFGDNGDLIATVEDKAEGGLLTLAFDRAGSALDAVVAAIGDVPLPPYIASRRATEEADRADYQTVYAEEEGAVAAPTAGLHFTPRVFDALDRKGVAVHKLTLHVGAGTFLPVKADDTDEHRMHAEWGTISRETADALNAVRAAGRRVVAVGTTSLRLLESAASADGRIGPFAGETDIFITPGYRFRAVDALVTNFHLPRSTLFMLVCAFAGTDAMKRAYAHAIATGYRFYSYGDACLLFPTEATA